MPTRKHYIGELIEVKEDNEVTIYGIGKPKTMKLPKEVWEWVKESYVAKRILEELVTHYKFRSRLSHPGSLRSLILLLYARAHNTPPYKVARKYGIAPEQLYRIERGLKKDNLYDFTMNLLSLEE
ncbi:MAG: hypothetical protein GSR86_04390 [Desulfurococcales archaeon]|nr:hypothetical protein [Desulfurococcales archaeon]